MKKSEAVMVLSELLDEHAGVGSSCCNLGLSEENLGKVVDGLVKAGMLPPPDKEHFLEQVAARIKEEHLDNHGYPIGAKRAYYAKRGAVLALKTKWDDEDAE